MIFALKMKFRMHTVLIVISGMLICFFFEHSKNKDLTFLWSNTNLSFCGLDIAQPRILITSREMAASDPKEFVFKYIYILWLLVEKTLTLKNAEYWQILLAMTIIGLSLVYYDHTVHTYSTL